MDIKHYFKKLLQDYFKSRIHYSSNTDRLPFDYKDINKMGLLFFIEGKEDLDRVRAVVRLARKDNKKTNPIIFSDVNHSVDVITDRGFFIFNADDFDYRWKPKSELKTWLKENEYDLLINFCFKDIPEVLNMYSIVNSNFKIGNQYQGSSNLNDLTINIKKKQVDFNAFYNLAIENLRMLNIKRN